MIDSADRTAALDEARDCLEETIAGRINRDEEIPLPAESGKGNMTIPLAPAVLGTAPAFPPSISAIHGGRAGVMKIRGSSGEGFQAFAVRDIEKFQVAALGCDFAALPLLIGGRTDVQIPGHYILADAGLGAYAADLPGGQYLYFG